MNMSFFSGLYNRHKEKQQARDEEVVRELFQVCEHNGEIWLTFEGSPVIPESMLTQSAIETVHQLRKKYLEDGTAKHYR